MDFINKLFGKGKGAPMDGDAIMKEPGSDNSPKPMMQTPPPVQPSNPAQEMASTPTTPPTPTPAPTFTPSPSPEPIQTPPMEEQSLEDQIEDPVTAHPMNKQEEPVDMPGNANSVAEELGQEGIEINRG